MNELRELARLSARIGADLRLVQGGGGNTSIKADNRLWVKASGTWLSQAEEKSIFVSLPLDEIRRRIAAGDAEDLSDLAEGGDGLRPSIETTLHAIFPHAAVVHVHSVNAIAWSVEEGGREALEKRLHGLAWAWVPYRKPGLPLCKAIMDAQHASDQRLDLVVLANHGLVVAAENCADVEALLEGVEERLAREERSPPPWNRRNLDAVNDAAWCIPEEAGIHAIATDGTALQVARQGVLYPDHAVFLGHALPEIEPGETVSGACRRIAADTESEPRYLVVEGAGVLVPPELTAGARAMLWAMSLVGRRLGNSEGVSYLAEHEVGALLGWTAEKFRQKIDQNKSGGQPSK